MSTKGDLVTNLKENLGGLLPLRDIPQKEMGFNYDTNQNMLIVGTTRSGKTTAMLNIIEHTMKRGEPIFIVSGKNGANDKFSMYRQVKALAEKYRKPLYAFSTHHDINNNFSYNPFKYSDINGVSNCLTVMAQFSDSYYESNFEYYVICCCELLQLAGKQLALQNIMKMFNWKTYSLVVKQLHDLGSISDDEAEEYLENEDVAEIARQSRARFNKYLKGSGKRIFAEGKPQISVSDVKRESGVFVMDLDGLQFEDFSYALGTMVVSDIRTMISCEKDVSQRRLIVFDELSVFFSKMLPNIYSQAVGFGYQSIAGAQSFADLDCVSPELTERMIENSNMFGIMKQNSAKDAERAAEIIGTELGVESTWRKTGQMSDGLSSNKTVRRFKVHTDDIKELDQLEMIYYDKTQKGEKRPVKLHWSYLDLDL